MPSDTGTVLGIIVAVLLFFLSVIGTLTMIIFNGVRKQIEDNTRHLNSIMATIGPLMWRLITLEDWMEAHHGYRPPRDIGWSEEPRRHDR